MNNRYQIIESLYRINSVDVQRCIDKETQKEVCIKYLMVQNIEDLKYIINEIMALFNLSKFDHFLKIISYELIPMFDQYNNELKEVEKVMIITEYYRRGDLEQEIKRRKRENNHFTDQELLKFFSDLLKGFKIMQENKLSHRDIKADNIFISDDGKLLIGDLGSSTMKKDSDVTLIGTSFYLSPEVRYNFMRFNGGLCGPRVSYDPFLSDVWSLGITFFYMITFDKPQEFLNQNTIAHAANDAIMKVKNPLIQDLLRNMLKIDPNERMDFIKLSNRFESNLNPRPEHLLNDSGVNCSSCKKSSNLVQCTNCSKEFHPECLRKLKYFCNNCSFDLSSKFETLFCKGCMEEVSQESFKIKCEHRLCFRCRAQNINCLSCIGFEIFDSSQGDYSQLNILTCPTDGNVMNRENKAIYCGTHTDYRLCIVCKNFDHQKSCAIIGDSNRFHCIMCSEISYKESSSFFVECLNCSTSYCYVCFKPINETSHLKCANLFGFNN